MNNHKKNTPRETTSTDPDKAPADGACSRRKSRSSLACAIDKLAAKDGLLEDLGDPTVDAVDSEERAELLFRELGIDPAKDEREQQKQQWRRKVAEAQTEIGRWTAKAEAWKRELKIVGLPIEAQRKAINQLERAEKRLEYERDRYRQFINLLINAESKPANRPAKARSKPLGKHERVIRQAIRRKLTGQKYVEYLDDHRLTTPESWQNDKDDPSPRSYKSAFHNPHWKEQIYKEKNRVKTRMKS